jgi:hypothetical protein
VALEGRQYDQDGRHGYTQLAYIRKSRNGAKDGHAQYPDKAITFVVRFAAGSATDQLARALGTEVTRITEQSVVVDDKPGASGFVNVDLPAKSVAEFIALGKRKPGKISFGSGSSSSRVAGELFQQIAGIELLHVPWPVASPRRSRSMRTASRCRKRCSKWKFKTSDAAGGHAGLKGLAHRCPRLSGRRVTTYPAGRWAGVRL